MKINSLIYSAMMIIIVSNPLNSSSQRKFFQPSYDQDMGARDFTAEYTAGAPSKKESSPAQRLTTSSSLLDRMDEDSDEDTPPPATPESRMRDLLYKSETLQNQKLFSLEFKVHEIEDELEELQQKQTKETEWIEAVRIRLKNVFERLTGLENLLKDLLKNNQTTMRKSEIIPFWDHFPSNNFSSLT